MSKSSLAAAVLGVVAAGLGVWLVRCNTRLSEQASEMDSLKALVETQRVELESQRAVVESQRLDLARLGTNANEASQRVGALVAEKSSILLKLQAFEAKQAARILKHEEFTVGPGELHPYTLAVDAVPGVLFGSWRASGTSSGGADDTLVGFRITDPTDALLSSTGNVAQWKFAVRVGDPGTYTFVFDNKGLMRQTARKVFLDVTYLPD